MLAGLSPSFRSFSTRPADDPRAPPPTGVCARVAVRFNSWIGRNSGGHVSGPGENVLGTQKPRTPSRGGQLMIDPYTPTVLPASAAISHTRGPITVSGGCS